MSSIRVSGASSPQAGEMIEVTVRGESFAVCNVAGTLHAIGGQCPHRGGPLAQGALHGYSVVCPWHAWEFDCRTGESDLDPEIKVRTVAVREAADGIYLDLP